MSLNLSSPRHSARQSHAVRHGMIVNRAWSRWSGR
ncbi:hypothetical protein FHS44_001188 [Streptosporangium saharense]|uniref:Uncharacterized protein n=1 Tax=Streptosporangium saharense TaxID=1706840 RepID=A0A7W7VKW4_9ACTN|nr:hypothetical protein [Streptosporangium saharense]